MAAQTGSKDQRPRYRPADRTESTPEKILRAASELFLKRGFPDTSLDEIAESAGVTKPTIYSHFGSKEGLLLSVTEAHCEHRAAGLMQMLRPSGDTHADLLRFSELFMEGLLSEDSAGWHRLAMSEAQSKPEVGVAIFAAGPQAVLEAMTGFLDVEVGAGRVTCEDTATAAEQFLGALLGINPFRLMTRQPLPSKRIRRKRARMAVDAFMTSYGAQ